MDERQDNRRATAVAIGLGVVVMLVVGGFFLLDALRDNQPTDERIETAALGTRTPHESPAARDVEPSPTVHPATPSSTATAATIGAGEPIATNPSGSPTLSIPTASPTVAAHTPQPLRRLSRHPRGQAASGSRSCQGATSTSGRMPDTGRCSTRRTPPATPRDWTRCCSATCSSRRFRISRRTRRGVLESSWVSRRKSRWSPPRVRVTSVFSTYTRTRASGST